MDPTPQKIDTEFAVRFDHRLRFTWGAFDPRNSVLGDLVERTTGVAGAQNAAARTLFFVDDGVVAARRGILQEIQEYAQTYRHRILLAGPVVVVPGGEQAKNDRAVYDRVCGAIHDGRICRRSYVIAVGGGAVLDVVGFAAATAHRGVRLIRLPTTTLAQGDSGVGVKCGINAFGKKNYLGAFAPPWAVVNDEQFLTTLPDRDWRSGFSEAVKVAVGKDRTFFEQIARSTSTVIKREFATALGLLRRSAQLHLDHIVSGGDAFELHRGRPLDMGHWAAHKLEQMTGFELRHGEAVAIGLGIDCVYAAMAGMMPWKETDRVLACLRALGFALHHPAMERAGELLEGLEEFREHLGGPMTLTLPIKTGRTRDVRHVETGRMSDAVKWLAEQEVSREVKSKVAKASGKNRKIVDETGQAVAKAG